MEGSGNLVFRQFIEPFAAVLHAREDLHSLPERVSESVIADHRAVVKSIERGDGDAAEERSRTLIEKARAELSQRLPPA